MVIWIKFSIPVHFISLIPKMSMFTLAISCLATSNLPCLIDLTFQVPMQYCSLHRTLLPSLVRSTTGYCFCFGSISSLFLVISPLISSISGTYRPGEFIFQCPIFLPFHNVHGVLKANGLLFPSPVDHILPQVSTMTHLSCVALHAIAHSCIELDKSVVHMISLISFLWLLFTCTPSDGKW